LAYLSIKNLYSDPTILMYRRCFSLEKLHGTSTNIRWKDGKLSFFSGGCKHENFVAIFDQEALIKKIEELGLPDFIVFGEGYGGKQQAMSATYGKELKFAAFDVKIHDCWLDVPNMDQFATRLGLEVVDWVEIDATLEAINAERNKFSVQAIRNGCGDDKKREGVVLRPLVEVKKSNGSRVIAKHKNEEFRETKTKREVDPEKIKILKEVKAISEEWVTRNRLDHVLDKVQGKLETGEMLGPEHTKDVILSMIEDVEREGKGEIVESKSARKAIVSRTAQMFKIWQQEKIREENS